MSRDGDRSHSVTARWAALITASQWADVPAAVRHEAKRSLLNMLGCSFGAARHPDVDTLIKLVVGLSGPPQATVLGRCERFDILSAAFVNAVSANLLDFDDTHLATVIHPSAPVAPPLLALSEQGHLSGGELLHAFVLGVEIECRLGNAVSPNHYARGWHITATCGVAGAAAACPRLIGLDAAAVAHAIGIAVSQSAGIAENLATGAKNVGIGNAARNGPLAALLAQSGFTAAPRAIEGPQGWAHAMGAELMPDALFAGFGETWEIMNNACKPYPCGIVLHAVIDACFDLRERHALAAADIAAVTVAGHPLLLARADRDVANERDAKISIQHSVAAVFLLGGAGTREFSSAVVMGDAMVEFRARVRAETDPALPIGAARVSVQTTDGRLLSAEVLHARGSLQRPLTDGEIERKVRGLVPPGFSACDVDHFINAVWELDHADNVSTLMRLLAAT